MGNRPWVAESNRKRKGWKWSEESLSRHVGMTGKKHSENTRSLLSEVHSGHSRHSEIQLEKIRESNRSRRGIKQSPEQVRKRAEANRGQKRTQEQLRRIFAHKEKNKPEAELEKILAEISDNWRFVGNGKLGIGGKCPDFWDGGKCLIEHFGDYWHGERARCYVETEEGRIEHFADNGYFCLVVWEHELKDCITLVRRIKSWYKERGTQNSESTWKECDVQIG